MKRFLLNFVLVSAIACLGACNDRKKRVMMIFLHWNWLFTAKLNSLGSGSITIGLSDWETGEEIKLDSDEKSLSSAGGLFEVKVTHNADFKVNIPQGYAEWISQVPSSKDTTESVRFEVKPNKVNMNREGKILFCSAVGGEVIESVTVQQASNTAVKVHVEVPGTLGYIMMKRYSIILQLSQ